jgi:hypothetical protein
MPAVVGSVSAADDDPRVPKPNILKNLRPPPSFSIILAGEAAGAAGEAGKELVKNDLSSGNSWSELASCVFPVCETRADERNGLTISDKLCTDIASPPLYRRNVSKWQCRRLLVLLFCFTKSAGNI